MIVGENDIAKGLAQGWLVPDDEPGWFRFVKTWDYEHGCWTPCPPTWRVRLVPSPVSV